MSIYRIVDTGPDFLVVYKSPGTNMHFQGQTPGLCALVREDLRMPALWPVHRLDQDTSGLVLLATTKNAARDLGLLFQNQQVNKFYLALTDKTPKKKHGLIQGDMQRSRRKTWKLCRSLHSPARTQIIARSVILGLRLVVLRPLTGKTHQLRVAMKALGAPILGDRLYHEQVYPWPDRLYLHAHTLCFTFRGQQWTFCCPPDEGQYFSHEKIRQGVQDLGSLVDLPWPALG